MLQHANGLDTNGYHRDYGVGAIQHRSRPLLNDGLHQTVLATGFQTKLPCFQEAVVCIPQFPMLELNLGRSSPSLGQDRVRFNRSIEPAKARTPKPRSEQHRTCSEMGQVGRSAIQMD